MAINPIFENSRLNTRWMKKEKQLLKNYTFPSFIEIILSLLPGSIGRKYKAERGRRISKLQSVKNRRFFKGYQVAGAINIAQHHVLKSKEDLQQAKVLFKQIKNDPVANKNYNLRVRKNLQSRSIEGICFGISVDVAKQILIDKRTPEEVMISIERGATAEACANQEVYLALAATRKDSIGDLFALLDQLSKVKGMPPPYDANFKEVRRLLDELHDSEHTLNDVRTNPEIFILSHKIAVAKRPHLKKELDWAFTLYQIQSLDKNLRSIPKKTRIALKTLLKNAFMSLIRILDKPIFEIETKNKMLFCNPRIANFLLSTIPRTIYYHGSNTLIAASRGLKFTPCIQEMALQRFFKTDHDYLLRVQYLKPGVYMLGTDVGKGRHAITLIINKDKSGYIIDPNGVQIAFDEIEQSVGLLLDVLSFYKKKPGHTTRRLELFRYEAQ